MSDAPLATVEAFIAAGANVNRENGLGSLLDRAASRWQQSGRDPEAKAIIAALIKAGAKFLPGDHYDKATSMLISLNSANSYGKQIV